MDTQNNAGSSMSLRQQLCDLNLYGRESTEVIREIRQFAYVSPIGLTVLVEALTQGNPSLKGALLRHWGVR